MPSPPQGHAQHQKSGSDHNLERDMDNRHRGPIRLGKRIESRHRSMGIKMQEDAEPRRYFDPPLTDLSFHIRDASDEKWRPLLGVKQAFKGRELSRLVMGNRFGQQIAAERLQNRWDPSDQQRNP